MDGKKTSVNRMEIPMKGKKTIPAKSSSPTCCPVQFLRASFAAMAESERDDDEKDGASLYVKCRALNFSWTMRFFSGSYPLPVRALVLFAAR
jgi:hypothetical protein